ncbi:MAG: cation transporter [Clostridia bacterium]|nr:cation transporter [Clostridia bacterium]
MKTERNILIAFLLNALFAVFELVGGVLTGSVAILSDAVHDLGDATSIGVSFFLEHKSRGGPNETYTYGYARYSVMGSAITTLVLLISSLFVIVQAVRRLLSPTEIDYSGMILFAVIGVIVNAAAAIVTHAKETLNQRAVNLHMLEDVLGWIVVLIGAIVIRYTDLLFLDSLMSLGVAVFILVHAARNLRQTVDLLLEKAPSGIAVSALCEHLREINGVVDVHHVHLWSLDGDRHYATMHIVANGDPHAVKERVREELREHGIGHATLELESTDEPCEERCCTVQQIEHHHHHHHH